MFIKKIKINNYKGFQNSTIEFHPNLNVLIGSNASGKTTLLTALVKSIYNITRNFVRINNNKEILNLEYTDINYEGKSCFIVSTIANFPNYNHDVLSVTSKAKPGEKADLDNLNNISESNVFIDWYKQRVQNNLQTVPIFKYYPANRSSAEYQEIYSPDTYAISQLETWSNLYQNSLSYSRFFDWFFDHETNELRLQRDYNDFTIESPDLKGVRIALTEAFKKLEYGNAVIKTKQIKRSKSSKLTPTLIIENLNTKKIDDIDNKSDGEKAIITLVADIAYNLSLAKDFTIDNNFLNSPGVVMIDEIENHLHPNWQREIVPILTSTFPNIQFFVATHSPQVLSSVKSESIYSCQDFQVDQIKLKTKGEDSNALLKYVFNSTERPKEYIELLKQFYIFIEGNAEYEVIQNVINKIQNIEKEDKSTDIHNLIDELNLQFAAYKFEREHETNK